MEATRIHELDVVRLREPATGRTLDGARIQVEAGATGAVVLERVGAAMVEVEIVDERTGETVGLVALKRTSLDVVWRHRRRTEAA